VKNNQWPAKQVIYADSRKTATAEMILKSDSAFRQRKRHVYLF